MVKLDKTNVRSVLQTVLDQFCVRKAISFDDVLLVGMQHILDTTVDMLSVMKGYGLKHVVIGGKRYSTNIGSARGIEALGFTYIPDGYQLGYGRFDGCMQDVVHRIWSAAIDKMKERQFRLLIILDDGADLLQATPGEFFSETSVNFIKNKPDMIVGIEQTRGGTNHPLFSGLPFPIIDVAGSFVKAEIEYPKVAKLVAKKIFAITEEIYTQLGYQPVVGILGYGTMGKAVAKVFSNAGLSVIVYDKNSNRYDNLSQVVSYDNSSVLIANADIVIGCTGEDITAKQDNLSALLYSRRPKWLISTGSKDHEFNSLLRDIQNNVKGLGCSQNHLATIQYKNRIGVTLNVLRGGFPINFTNEAHSVDPEHIWPTRAALMLACALSVYLRKNYFDEFLKNINIFKLPPDIQALILQKYSVISPRENTLLGRCNLSQDDLYKYIADRSDGLLLDIMKQQVPEDMAI